MTLKHTITRFCVRFFVTERRISKTEVLGTGTHRDVVITRTLKRIIVTGNVKVFTIQAMLTTSCLRLDV